MRHEQFRAPSGIWGSRRGGTVRGRRQSTGPIGGTSAPESKRQWEVGNSKTSAAKEGEPGPFLS